MSAFDTFLLQLGYVFDEGVSVRGVGEVLGRVRKIEGLVGLSRRANALHVAVLSALMVLVALPAGALAASTVAVDGSVLRVTGDAANNVITVNLASAHYTVTDTTGATAGAGCTQGTATVVTCPATGIAARTSSVATAPTASTAARARPHQRRPGRRHHLRQ